MRFSSPDHFKDAWHVVTFSDPLVESDEEFADEHVRLDYSLFFSSIYQLRFIIYCSEKTSSHQQAERKRSYA